MAGNRTVITTEYAPAAIGPYSQAIALGDLVFTSGQIPLDPTTGQVVEGGIEVQTRRVLDNLAAVLQAAGSSLRQVVKTTIFLADMNDFAAVNTIYAEYFGADPPARSTVQVARLPRDVRVEIEAIATRSQG
jgi:2-iminobutanoate/2-iminopropanoate deaminase